MKCHHYESYVDDNVEVNPELIIVFFCSQDHSMFKAVLKMNRDGGKGSKKETGMSSACKLDGRFRASVTYFLDISFWCDILVVVDIWSLRCYLETFTWTKNAGTMSVLSQPEANFLSIDILKSRINIYLVTWPIRPVFWIKSSVRLNSNASRNAAFNLLQNYSVRSNYKVGGKNMDVSMFVFC